MNRIQYSFLCMLLMGLVASSSLLAQDQGFRSQVPVAGPAPKIQMGDFVDFKLENGLHVIVVENHKLPRVSYRLFVDVPLHKEGDKAGAGELMGSLLRSGTAKRSKSQLDEDIDFIGARISTSEEGAFGSALSRHKEVLLSTMAEIVQQPVFPEEEFEKNRRQVLSGLAQAKEEADQIAASVGNMLRYGNHPYGEITTEQTVKNITVDDIRQQYNMFFRPSRSYLVMVGDITVAEARKLAQTHFGAWQGVGQYAVQIFDGNARPEGTVVDFVNKSGAVQSLINVTYPIMLKPGTQDAIKAQVLDFILGSGFSGRLFQNLREDKAYTYGAYSSIESDQYMGAFTAEASVRNEVTDSAVYEFIYELDRISKEMVTEDELSRAKNMINGSFARGLERPETVANYALNTIRYKLPRSFYPEYLANLAKVSRADVLEIAQELITPERAHILVVGDKELANKLTKFATDGQIHYYDAYGKPLEMLEMPMDDNLSAQDILNRYIDAIGGSELVSGISDMAVSMTTDAQGMQLTVNILQKQGDKYKMKVSMNGMTVQQTILNGNAAIVGQMGDSHAADDKELASLKEQALIMPEMKYAEMGYTLELLGVETVESQNAYALKVTSPAGNTVTEYYDMTTGLKLRAVASQEGLNITTDFQDYRPVGDGVLYPHLVIMRGMMPMPLEMKVQSVSINGGIADKEFEVK